MHTIQPYINPRKHVYSIIIGRVTVIEWPLRGRAEPYTTCAETCAPTIRRGVTCDTLKRLSETYALASFRRAVTVTRTRVAHTGLASHFPTALHQNPVVNASKSSPHYEAVASRGTPADPAGPK
eukprot:1196069-Prorocentrum_minimum.AAC.3